MLAIEHNPTHIEKALSEGRAPEHTAPPEGEIRLEKTTLKKGRKNNGLGTFAKLLAGLMSKKTLRQTGTLGPREISVSPDTSIPQKTLDSLESAENRAKKTAFLHLSKEKGLSSEKVSKENDSRNVFAQKKENRETIRDQNRSEPDLFALARQFSAAETAFRENRDFSPEPVSLKDGQFTPITKDIPERKFPFRREMPENQLQVERNIGLQSKKEANPLQTEDLPGDRADTKKTGRKRNTVTLEIHDLRTQAGSEAGTIAEQGLKGAEEARNGPVEEIVLELKPGGRNEGPGTDQKAVPAGENFEQLLARELQGDLSADIVRQAAVILKDGGEGTIKLSLKPETLGKVKIHLEMAENRISGRIIVESEEALRAFEREIHSLEQSFRDSGFEASLNAALDYRNDGQRWKEKEVLPFYSERFAASYEESGETEFSGFGFGMSAVNMLA